MTNPNEFLSSIEFLLNESDDQQFPLANGEPADLSTEKVFIKEDCESLVNGPPVNVAPHQSGADGSMDMIAQMDDDALTMAFMTFGTMPENKVKSTIGTVEVVTNAATPELNVMACSGMWTIESYLGIEVATNVATTEVDTIIQTDGNAPTIATVEIGETSGLIVASSYEGTIEVATNVAATEMDTAAGIDADASTMAIVPYIGTREFVTNVAASEMDIVAGTDVHASTMAIVPYIGIGEVVTNVAATEMDTAAGTGVDASTMAVVPYVGTGKVVTNVATTELGMTIEVNDVKDNVLQNSATNNWATNVFKRKISKFSLPERLKGWTIKINPRPKDPTRTDRFFIHVGSGIQFRSKNEVDDFIHFGFHPKRQVPNAPGLVNNRHSIRRNINWRLIQRGVLPGGTTPIYDISFLELGAKENPNNIISIEGKISDPEIDNPCKRRKTAKLLIDDKERVEAFNETQHAPKIKDEEDNNKDKNKYKDIIGNSKDKMYED